MDSGGHLAAIRYVHQHCTPRFGAIVQSDRILSSAHVDLLGGLWFDDHFEPLAPLRDGERLVKVSQWEAMGHQ